MILVESQSRSSFLFEHDLFRKTVPTFWDHALGLDEGQHRVEPAEGERV
jgi:hypothetical protein